MANLIQFFSHGIGASIGSGVKGTFRGLTGKHSALPFRMAMGGAIGGVAGYMGTDYNSPTMQLQSVAKGAFFGAALGGSSWAIPRMARGAHRLNMAMGRKGLKFAEARADRAFIGPRLEGGFISKVKEGASSSIRQRRMQEFAHSPVGMTGRGVWSAGKKASGPTGSAIKRAAWFAVEHPVVTGVGVAGIYGGYSYMNRDTSSPTMTGATMNVNYNQQAIAAEQLQMGMISPIGMVGTAPQMMGRMHRAMMESTYGLTQGLHKGRHG